MDYLLCLLIGIGFAWLFTATWWRRPKRKRKRNVLRELELRARRDFDRRLAKARIADQAAVAKDWETVGKDLAHDEEASWATSRPVEPKRRRA